MAVTDAPSFSPSSRAASTVIDATRRWPFTSISTFAMAAPSLTLFTVPDSWLRALIFRAAQAIAGWRPPVPGLDAISYEPIGVVRSPYAALDGMPLQTVAAPEVEATVELEPRVHGALRDLDGFSHVWLLVHLHRVDGWSPEVVPFLDEDRPRGVLATRSPRHPNPIGLSLVELVGGEPGALRVRGADPLAGPPVLDVKPYVPLFDAREAARTGWFAAAAERARTLRSDTRYGA